MKFLLLIIVVVVSAAAGYLTEPKFRMQLTGKSADSEKPKTTPKSKATPKPDVEDEIPFETNPVEPEPAPPVGTTPDPVVPTIPEVVDLGQPVTPDPATPVVPEVPVTPVQTADPVLVMKASLASGQISKFTAAQVLEWEAGTTPETIDGETYQIGNVTYQAETPFGTKNLPAKALIKDGKVVRWISPKSGMQIE